MLKVDLITGFLGAGKTTFIRGYLHYLESKGMKAAIIENEFGGADVDNTLLKNEGVEIKTLTGVCMCCKGKDMFNNMMIGAASAGYDRLLVEPSGIYDVDEFFSSMLNPVVAASCEIGSIITINDASVNEKLSAEAEYISFSQLLASGKVVFSKSQLASEEQIRESVLHLNSLMQKHGSSRTFSDSDLLIKDWSHLEDADYEDLMKAGYRILDHKRETLEHESLFQAYSYASYCRSKEQLEQLIRSLFADDTHGTVLRIKGHIRDLTGQWYELNCTGEIISIRKAEIKRGLFVIIGENLDNAWLKGQFLSKAEAKALMQQN